jgi:hypothetical protein
MGPSSTVSFQYSFVIQKLIQKADSPMAVSACQVEGCMAVHGTPVGCVGPHQLWMSFQQQTDGFSSEENDSQLTQITEMFNKYSLKKLSNSNYQDLT